LVGVWGVVCCSEDVAGALGGGTFCWLPTRLGRPWPKAKPIDVVSRERSNKKIDSFFISQLLVVLGTAAPF
jgi:hypothetical protein